jgi:transcriptional regulator with XRE-family HTH domain
MDYSKAIRIARALADVPQRELAKRISIDSSLISMLENGKRRPSLKTLEKIAHALKMPFHLLVLLGTEPEDSKTLDSKDLEQLAIGLTKLLLGESKNATGARTNRRSQETEHIKSKPTSSSARNRSRKTG